MQDDPESGECFQHEMILKRQRSGRGTLRVNASHHAACSHLTLEQMRRFVAASGGLTLAAASREEIYGFAEGALS